MPDRIIAVAADATTVARDGVAIALVEAGEPTLPALVETLRRRPELAGAVVAGSIDPLARVTPPSDATAIRVGDADDKVACTARVRAAWQAAGASATQLDAIEQCVDELVENALFAAPVGRDGAPLFAHLSPRQRVDLRTDRDAEVVFGVAGTQLVVVVRDAFGRLTREALLQHLEKGLHAENAVDRKVAGAGLGLFLVASTARAVSITVTPGAATEIACAFELGRLAPAIWIDYVERLAAATPTRTSARPTPRARRREQRLAVAVFGAAVLASVGISAALPPPRTTVVVEATPADAIVEVGGRIARHTPAGAVASSTLDPVFVRVHRDGYETAALVLAPTGPVSRRALVLAPVATLEVDSTPSDAAVSVAGTPLGSTPLRVTSLRPSSTVELVFEREGYQRSTARVVVPARGASARHQQTLVASPDAVRVRLVTTPPGARVIRDGVLPSADRTYTPADVVVTVGQATRFTFSMPGRAPLVAVITATPADAGREYGGELVAAP